MKNLNRFMEVYVGQLAECVADRPHEYAYPVDKVPTVVNRVRNGICHGSFNHRTSAFRRTCKALGIRHTRRAILEFLVS